MLPRITVTARGARRILDSNPWVVRGEVLRGDAEPGTEVEVLDERKRFVAIALYCAAPAPIALRVLAREPTARLDELLPSRLAAAIARRAGLGDTCRLVHAEADLLPGLVVDRWGEACVVQTGTLAMDRRVDAIAALLAALPGVRIVIRRDDGSARDHESLPRLKAVLRGDGPTIVEVTLDGIRRELDVMEDRKTGGFLDQRFNQRRVAELPRGGDVVDAFTHHGGFALAMAARAGRVLALDQDPAAIARARRNAELSGIANVDFEVVDAFARLRDLERSGRKFQVVCVDPPALAKRGTGAVDAAMRAYQEVNLRAFRLCEPEGFVVTSSCSGRVTPAMFGEMLAQAAAAAGRPVTLVERRGAGIDHPTLLGVPATEYLKCWILQVL